jgi:chemotaxis protein CheX
MSSQKRFIDFSKPFIDAAKNVFETMVYTKLEPQKPSIKEGNTSRGDVSSVLGLSGVYQDGDIKTPYKAMLVMAFPYDTYIKAASAMLMEEHTEYNDEITDVGGEICNMIMGNAKRDLKEMGYTTNMAIPSMIEGKNHSIHYPMKTEVVLIPIESDHGPLFIELCYSEGEAAKNVDLDIKKES